MKKQKKNNIDYWLSPNCDPRLCSLSLTRHQWMALLHLLFLLLRRPKLHRLQLHREHRQHKQTTGSNAKKNNSNECCYSEQVRKQSRRQQRASVLKSTCLKWLTSETIEQVPYLAPRKWGKIVRKVSWPLSTNLLRPFGPSSIFLGSSIRSWWTPLIITFDGSFSIYGPLIPHDTSVLYSRAISRLLFTASAFATIFNLKFSS